MLNREYTNQGTGKHATNSICGCLFCLATTQLVIRFADYGLKINKNTSIFCLSLKNIVLLQRKGSRRGKWGGIMARNVRICLSLIWPLFTEIWALRYIIKGVY